MTRALDSAGVVELAILQRSGLDESRHLGAAAVVGPDGTLIRALGDPDACVFGRSSLKFFQALAVLRSGVALRGAELVLATASHAGTPAHVEVVEAILTRAGLTVDALQCPADWPLDSDTRASAATDGRGKQRLFMNCSGKHAAFLLACVENGWPVDSYLEPGHPLQVLIKATVEEHTGAAVDLVGVDGCGAPVFAITLHSLARAVSRLARRAANGDDMDAAALVTAILADPWALDGPGRANTVVVEQLGLIAKGGAEGVIVMAAPDGSAVALKMIDGSARATSLVALALLASVGAIDADEAARVGALVTEQVLGGGKVVGSIRTTALVSSP